MTRIVRPDGKVQEKPPEVLRRLPWKPENVDFIRKALSGVVNEWGTGTIAKLPGIEEAATRANCDAVQVSRTDAEVVRTGTEASRGGQARAGNADGRTDR